MTQEIYATRTNKDHVMIEEATKLSEVLKKHGEYPDMHELWDTAMPKLYRTVKKMDEKIEKLEEALRFYATQWHALKKELKALEEN